MQKQLEEPRSILMSSADRVAISMGLSSAIIVSNTHAVPANCNTISKYKQSIYECLLGSVLTTFLRRHKFWLHRQFSSAQFQKRRNDR